MIDDLELPPMSDIRPSETIIMSTEFKAGISRYLSQLGQTLEVRTLEDIVNFNREHADAIMPWFQQELLENSLATEGLKSQTYLNALETCKELSRDLGIDRLSDEHKLDAIIAPTTCTPWLIDWVNGDNRSGGSAGPAAVAGYPSVTVPAGYVHKLPVGISFFSKAWRDIELLKIAYAYEQQSLNRIPPELNTIMEPQS